MNKRKWEILRIKLYKWIFGKLSNLVKYSFLVQWTIEKDGIDWNDCFCGSEWFDGKENLATSDITIIEEMYG